MAARAPAAFPFPGAFPAAFPGCLSRRPFPAAFPGGLSRQIMEIQRILAQDSMDIPDLPG